MKVVSSQPDDAARSRMPMYQSGLAGAIREAIASNLSTNSSSVLFMGMFAPVFTSVCCGVCCIVSAGTTSAVDIGVKLARSPTGFEMLIQLIQQLDLFGRGIAVSKRIFI